MKYLVGLPLMCSGEEFWTCDDLYFEDGSWQLRYLVAADGSFVFKERSLVSPQSIDRVELAANPGALPLTISKRALETAPDIGKQVPFSKEMEIAALNHFQLSPHWMSDPGEIGLGLGPGAVPEAPVDSGQFPEEVERNLRSLKEVLNYEVRNGESSFGTASDLILDISDFSVSYLAVDTKPSERGGIRLISTKQKDVSLSIDYASKSFRTECSSYHLLESPSADLTEGRLTLGDQQKIDLSSY